MKNFWQILPRPFTVLAPLDGVTDVVFRQMITELGKPDVLFTEFTSTDGIQSAGREKVSQRLWLKDGQKPVIAQIWGANPDYFYESAKYVSTLGFAGIDINMGCPDKTVIKHGACSRLITNHELAKEIIDATRKGAGDLPVSVKTRIGFYKPEVEEWIGFLLKQKLSALTVHLRTVEEMSKVPAHWEVMPKIMEMRNTLAPDTVIIGNGDIVSLTEIQEKYEKYACEGFMVGRGIFANPWMFNKEVQLHDIPLSLRFDTFLTHIELHDKTWGKVKNYANLKKFCKSYINNFPDAGVYREEIMKAKSIQQLTDTIIRLKTDLVTA